MKPAAVDAAGPGVVIAHAEIYVNRDTPARLAVVSENPIAAGVNGDSLALVRERSENETEYSADIRLRMGFNDLFVVLGDAETPRTFSAQLRKAGGQPIEPARLWIVDDQILMDREPDPALRKEGPQ